MANGKMKFAGKLAQYLDDRLQVLGHPGIEADPDADRHPDHRRHHHHHDDPQQGQEAQAERVPEDGQALLPGGDVGQHAVQAPAERGGDDRGEGDVRGAPPGGVADQAAVIDPGGGAHQLVDRLGHGAPAPPGQARPAGPPQQVEDQRPGLLARLGLLEAEPFRVRHQRPPEHDVDRQDHDDHGDDAPDDMPELALLHGHADVGAHPGQRVAVAADDDQLGRGEEEPAAAEAHHPVPDQPDRPAGHVDAPEPLPPRQPHAAGSPRPAHRTG